jgi:hypothetical protein
MSKKPALLLAAILSLAIMAGLTLTLGAGSTVEEARAQEFHRLVGGLGYGPALDLSGCDFAFDPRLATGCSYDCGPIPCGLYFCPHHAGSIFEYDAERPFPDPDYERPADAPLP